MRQSTGKRSGVLGALVIGALAVAAGSAFAQSHGAPPPPRGSIPPGTGWFCFEDPQPTGGSVFNCDRTLPACERLRSNRHANGEAVGTCGPDGVAYCFAFRDNMQHPPAAQHYCTRTAVQCDAMHTQLLGSGPLFSNISGCAEFH